VDALAERVDKIIGERHLLPDNTAALVGVSGGVDSMVLLSVLHSLALRHRWKLTVAHLNHQLRGRDADADERFVKRAAQKLRLPFESARQNVKQFASAHGVSVEMGARELRHRFLAETARKLGLRHIFLAHHADDQVELFFLRLLRGSGNQGLGGMEMSAPSPVDPKIQLLRPLLGIGKSELLAYAQAHGIAFRQDATNDSTDILRNRIRHKLLPLLRKDFQANIDRVVSRSMEISRAEGDFVAMEAVKWLRVKKGKVKFEGLHIALQRQIIQIELFRSGITPAFEQVETLRRSPLAWLSIEPRLAIRLNANGIIERREVDETLPEVGPQEMTVSVDDRGSITFGGLTLEISRLRSKKLPAARTRTEYFDANSVGSPIQLRHWRPGDRFQPIGLTHDVKLQDWFVNQKIPREKRHQLVVATNAAGTIFWVESLRIGEKFKITKETKAILQWRWR
jgi:tRNA(Ile)-lysidine synthase